jgi:toxin ParE1/3/4
MTWRVVLRPEVERDVTEAARWYESRQSELGREFVEDIIAVWESLEQNPLLNRRQDPAKNIHWRYAERFPYRVVYEVNELEHTVVIAAVLHAARHDRHWQTRV